tara:strand:+ start:1548 stop:1694 length:147 start_codon:yes stop_codon:yes gene_type:complete
MVGTEKPHEIYQETAAPTGSDMEVGKDLEPVDTVHGDEAVKGEYLLMR